jgi:SAM-dependent methyltransferase
MSASVSTPGPSFIDVLRKEFVMTQMATDRKHAEGRACCDPGCCGGGGHAGAEATRAEAPATPRSEDIVGEVRAKYARIAQSGGGCGCGTAATLDEAALSKQIGYTDDDLAAAGEANLGLGCGAPLALLALRPGETVLDLGSGPGLDAFLAARKVGPTGRVIGVDMTPAMLDRARASAVRLGLPQVEFRDGRLEQLPVVASSVDAVTSNCVINLVPDKAAVFREVARVLKPGGRLVISDIVLDGALPEAVAKDVFAYVGCISGAALRADYFREVAAAGLSGVEVLKDVDYLAGLRDAAPEEAETLLRRNGVEWKQLEGRVRSLTFRARKAA